MKTLVRLTTSLQSDAAAKVLPVLLCRFHLRRLWCPLVSQTTSSLAMRDAGTLSEQRLNAARSRIYTRRHQLHCVFLVWQVELHNVQVEQCHLVAGQ